MLQLSWTFEKEGMTLQWRWKCKQAPNCKKTTAEILDFLMDANITLSVRFSITFSFRLSLSAFFIQVISSSLYGIYLSVYASYFVYNGHCLGDVTLKQFFCSARPKSK